MASVGFGTVAPAVASPAGRRLNRRAAPSSVRVPSATKSVAAAAAAAKKEEKGLFDAIFGALYKEEQLLETDPILNKVEGKAVAAATPRTRADTEAKKAAAAAAGDDGGFNFGGLFSKKG